MAKPIISKFSVTDADKVTTVRFVCYDDGIDTIDYLIYDNASGNIVATKSIKATGKTIYRNFAIPAKTLTNRLDPYYIKVRVHNSEQGTASELSDAVLFYCHKKPTLAFMDISSETATKLAFPSYSFDLKYNYNEEHGEVLSKYKFSLYDSNKNLISEEVHYGAVSESFLVNGLDNSSTYYIRATGETVNGYTIDSGYYQIDVSYATQIPELAITAENKYTDGTIELKAVMKVTENQSFDTLKIKRRKVGTQVWTELLETSIAGQTGNVIVNYTDKYALGRNAAYQYCVAPTIDDIEQDTSMTIVNSRFDGAYLMDGNITYYVGLDPEVSDVTRNQSAGVETTLSGKYPVVFYGSEANYYTGQFSGTIIKFNRQTDAFDFEGSIDYREKFIDWLTNKKPKVLKIFDGRGWLMNVNGNVTVSADEHMDKVSISFGFVETGDLNKTDDLKDAALI